MDLVFRVTKVNDEKFHCTISLKFGDIFFTSLNTLGLQGEASICSSIREYLPLYCRKFLAFGIVVMI